MIRATETLTPLVRRILRRTLPRTGIRGRAVWSEEDLFQACLLHLLEKLRTRDLEHRDASSLEGWVATVTRNRLRQIARRVAAESRRLPPAEPPPEPLEEILESPQGDPAARAGKEEEIRILRRGLTLLPPRQSSLLRLRFLEGKRVSEICTLLGISRSTFTYQQREAMDFLRRHLWDQTRPGPKKGVTE
ncbi:MAG: RNA polymerase sigma factor [Planctomycetota bacterium]